MKLGKDVNGKELSIEERVEMFMDAQQMLGDYLGLAMAIPHGENMKMFDIWGKKKFEIELNSYTEVKKEKGKEPEIIWHEGEKNDEN